MTTSFQERLGEQLALYEQHQPVEDTFASDFLDYFIQQPPSFEHQLWRKVERVMEFRRNPTTELAINLGGDVESFDQTGQAPVRMLPVRRRAPEEGEDNEPVAGIAYWYPDRGNKSG